MDSKMKQWLPIALCCLPGIVAAAIVGVGVASGRAILGGPLGLGLIALAMLACPLSMGLMMRGARRDMTNRHDSAMADCCAPGEQSTAGESDQLAGLRAQREALEREIAELRTQV